MEEEIKMALQGEVQGEEIKMALEMADDKPSTGEPGNVIMRREIPKFDILYEECDEEIITELNLRVVYRHDGIKEQIEDELDLSIKLVDERICLETTAFEYPEDKDTGVTDLDNAWCVKELATDTQILNGQDVIVSDDEMNNGGPRPNVINNDDHHNLSVEEIVEDNTKDTDTDCLIFGDSLLKHLIKKHEKGKIKLKWTGKIEDLKHFVSLVFKCEGNWHTKKSGGKMNLHVFEERSGGFSLNYWSSNKTLLLQGNSATLIENKINNIIEKLSIKPAQTEKIMEVMNPESKIKGENKIVTKRRHH